MFNKILLMINDGKEIPLTQTQEKFDGFEFAVISKNNISN